MFNRASFNILIYKRFMMLIVVMTIMATALLPAYYAKNAAAQTESIPNEYIFRVLLLPDWTISEAIFAYELNGKYYLPLQELSDDFEFFADIEVENKLAQGFASKEENNFTIDGGRNELIVRGNRESLSEDAVLVSDFLATDDLYVQLEVLNAIWPISFNIDLANLTIFVETGEDLSFMRDRERKKKQKIAGVRKEQKFREKELLPRRDNDYQLLGAPVVDYQATYTFDTEEDNLVGTNNFSGLQNIGKMQADFSANYRLEEGNIERPDSIRLKFSRRSVGDEYLFIPGLRKIEAGDVTLRQRDLVANSSAGRGVTISNDNQSRDNEFDRITVEGVGPPGWEIELYNNEELIDFSTVPDDGLFFFEDVILGFGNNEIKILFFGPQGQVKEELRRYTAGGNMLSPNEFKYSAGLLDSDREFILLDNEARTQPRGVAKNLNTAYGVNKAVTVFGTYAELPNSDKNRKYLTAGAVASTPIGLFEAEAYKQLARGRAISVDYITKFFGIRSNIAASVFRDFESEASGFDLNRKRNEIRGQLSRNVKFFSIPIGLRFNVLRTKRETGIRTTDLDFTQTLSRSGVRVSNSSRMRLLDDRHESSTGGLTTTVREGPWQFRGTLNYEIYPRSLISTGSGEVRYRDKNNFQAALNASRDFQTAAYRVGVQTGYDFKRFLGTVESAYERGMGWEFVLRASTSLHPYTEDNSYALSSVSQRNASPVKAFVFLDKDADGEFNGDDEPIEGAKIKYGGGKSKTKTDENGYVIASVPSDKLQNVRLDTASLIDPYYISAYDGFSTVPIKGKMIETIFPVIETGSIEGSVYRKSSNRAVAGLELNLVNEAGETVLSVETAFDGFYVFEFVPPGSYSVQTDSSHVVGLLENSASIVPQDLYVYGHDVFIDDANMMIMEEASFNIEPAAGGMELGVFGPPEEAFGPAKMVIEQAAVEAAVQETPEQKISDIQPAAGSSQTIIRNPRFKTHNGKSRFVAEFSNEIDYEVLESDKTDQVQVVIKNALLEKNQTLQAQIETAMYESKIEQQDGNVVISISNENSIQLQFVSILPALQNGERRFLIDAQ